MASSVIDDKSALEQQLATLNDSLSLKETEKGKLELQKGELREFKNKVDEYINEFTTSFNTVGSSLLELNYQSSDIDEALSNLSTIGSGMNDNVQGLIGKKDKTKSKIEVKINEKDIELSTQINDLIKEISNLKSQIVDCEQSISALII